MSVLGTETNETPNFLVGCGGRQSLFSYGNASHCDHFSLEVTDKASVKYVQQICKAIFAQESLSVTEKTGNYPAPCIIHLDMMNSVKASYSAFWHG